MRKFLFCLAVLAGLIYAPVLRADTVAGQFSVTGISVTDTGAGLIFNPNTINVGAANTISGDFTQMLQPDEVGRITSPIDYADYIANSASLVFGEGTSSELLFTLATISEITINDVVIFTGTGTILAPGYEASAANIIFTTPNKGTTTFAATVYAPPLVASVPEPASLVLFGTGLVGMATTVRRRMV